MVAGKLMKLDEDRLANALTLALTPHVALNKGVGALSMWKGTRSAESAKCGAWAAILARDGMTGPPQPFEGRGGLWASRGAGAGGGGNGGGVQTNANGMGREFTLPTRGDGQDLYMFFFTPRTAYLSTQLSASGWHSWAMSGSTPVAYAVIKPTCAGATPQSFAAASSFAANSGCVLNG